MNFVPMSPTLTVFAAMKLSFRCKFADAESRTAYREPNCDRK